jgi:hypothetical protein
MNATSLCVRISGGLLSRSPVTCTTNLIRAVVLAVGAVACRASEAQFAERFAIDFQHARRTVSVFGVYKDGQMSSEAWNALRPRLEPVLGGSGCEIACLAPPASSDGRLFAAIDDYARANGPTDELLAHVAPAAMGDLILVLVEAGRLPAPEKRVSLADSPSPAGPSPGGSAKMGSHGRGFSTLGPTKHPGGADLDVLQLSASLFSVSQGRSVAVVDMRYGGTNLDEAVNRFVAKLAESLPESSCRGWHWDAKVDSEQIRSPDGG